MGDSPVQKIVYDSPPMSPVQIQYQDNSDEEVLIPQRKRRRGGTRQTRPERTQITQPIGQQAATDWGLHGGERLEDHESQGYTYYGDLETPMESLGVDSEFEAIVEGSRNPSHKVAEKDDEFLYFLDAVQAEECGLFQLTERLFVANGWNVSKRESTVRLSDGIVLTVLTNTQL